VRLSIERSRDSGTGPPASNLPRPTAGIGAGGFVPGVQVARAVAVLLVLAAHVVGLWTNQEQFRYPPWQVYLKGIDTLRIDHQAGGHMGLLLFFLVSGYIVSQAADSDTRIGFAFKRAARLIPAMILAVGATIVVGSLDQAAGFALPLGYNPAVAPAHALAEAVGLGPLLGGNAILFVLWTLNVEYEWYVLLAVLSGFARRHPAAATVAAMAVVFAFVEAVPAQFGPFTFSSDTATYIFVILIGRWIYVAHRRYVGVVAGVAGAVACLGLYAFTRWKFDGLDVVSGAHPRLAAALWATLIFCVLLRFVQSKPWRPVMFIADISYGIYLFHIPIMWLVLPIVSPGGRLFTLGLAITVALVIAVSWASYRFVETPIRRAVRRRLASRGASAASAAS
jgi:peptidoglycan/LPS O-acetylase OafA/YrhL